MEATAQLNVRLDPELKKAGDHVLAKHGLTPSQAIRGLYEKLTKGGNQAETALNAICGSAPEEERAEAERSLREARKMVYALYEQAGITEEDLERMRQQPQPSAKELLEQALWERTLEKDARSAA